MIFYSNVFCSFCMHIYIYFFCFEICHKFFLGAVFLKLIINYYITNYYIIFGLSAGQKNVLLQKETMIVMIMIIYIRTCIDESCKDRNQGHFLGQFYFSHCLLKQFLFNTGEKN